MAADEVAVLDAGFKLSQVRQARLAGYVLRLAKNFTARRNQPAPWKPNRRPPTYGQWVRPLARTYDGRHIAATQPDRVVTWEEQGRGIRAEIWTDLVLPGVVPDPHNETFQVLAIHDSLYSDPWLLATELPLKPATVKALYQDRWPVEQIPLAAKHMVGAHRQFVFASESIQRLPDLALLAGSILDKERVTKNSTYLEARMTSYAYKYCDASAGCGYLTVYYDMYQIDASWVRSSTSWVAKNAQYVWGCNTWRCDKCTGAYLDGLKSGSIAGGTPRWYDNTRSYVYQITYSGFPEMKATQNLYPESETISKGYYNGTYISPELHPNIKWTS